MNTLIRSEAFNEWLKQLKNIRVKSRIAARILGATHGNFGDCKPVGEGVSEMRIDIGPGYRVYYTRYKNLVYFLLTGGDKSTQSQDIKRAIKMARELTE